MEDREPCEVATDQSFKGIAHQGIVAIDAVQHHAVEVSMPRIALDLGAKRRVDRRFGVDGRSDHHGKTALDHAFDFGERRSRKVGRHKL